MKTEPLTVEEIRMTLVADPSDQGYFVRADMNTVYNLFAFKGKDLDDLNFQIGMFFLNRSNKAKFTINADIRGTT